MIFYYELGIALSILYLHVLTDLIFTITLQSRYYYYSHFTDKEIKAQRGSIASQSHDF